jgi:serine protease SohB
MILEMIKDYTLFLAKTATIALAIFLLIRGIVAIWRRQRRISPRKIRVKKLNRHYEYLRDAMKDEMLSEYEWKKAAKERRKQKKGGKEKSQKRDGAGKEKIFRSEI